MHLSMKYSVIKLIVQLSIILNSRIYGKIKGEYLQVKVVSAITVAFSFEFRHRPITSSPPQTQLLIGLFGKSGDGLDHGTIVVYPHHAFAC